MNKRSTVNLAPAAVARALAMIPLTAAVAMLVTAWPAAAQPAPRSKPAASEQRRGDFILAVVNQELVTSRELELRLARVQENAQRAGKPLPPEAQVRRQLLDLLIDERAQITHARESGVRVDESELDRAVASVAAQNQVSVSQLKQRLVEDGIDYQRFRKTIREQLLVERVRDREVQSRIRVSDLEVDTLIARQRSEASGRVEYNVAQILISVPDNATAAAVAERKARADTALARIKAGEPFDAVARQISDDVNKEQGGALGLRGADRLPDAFVERVSAMAAGQVADAPLRTGAGFHLLKLLERRDGQAFAITQTRARHILLRLSPQLDQQKAVRRLADYKQQVLGGKRGFEQLAKEHSEDGSAPQGGDLGWSSPGAFVPEFEEAMNALPLGGVSDPVVSRFGVHLIQVVERRQSTLDEKQQREQARNALREQKYEEAYAEWSRDLRARAYIELREPPL
jgi:peptidyl-prolyl cis-trans isomerase SurA